ncbi:hypothetical protein NDU88_004079 [Pleurodeles waltl]|uniref:Uncharacterized protein n=1 Tax=Pleurodeles waltl TaxID=8319 RepID=A0AAV7UEK4_PLEWA|nr:hypothetical protein NDU88_004079 [Pleurodeles waltl]
MSGRRSRRKRCALPKDAEQNERGEIEARSRISSRGLSSAAVLEAGELPGRCPLLLPSQLIGTGEGERAEARRW